MNNKLYKEYKKYSRDQLRETFRFAFYEGQLDVIKVICTSPDLAKKFPIKYHLQQGLDAACRHAHFDIVKYVLTAPEIKGLVNIHDQDDSTFLNAIKGKELKIIKYLLTSEEIEKHSNINVSDDLAFREACKIGHVEIIKYLASSPELKNHSNIHAKMDEPFISAFKRYQLTTIRCLIYDLNLEKTIGITNFLKEFPGVVTNEINKMFEQRDLNNALNNELSLNSNKEKKNKI